MNSTLYIEQIQCVELELTNICNLKCAMCTLVNASFNITQYIRPINEWIIQLDLMTNLNTVILSGKNSEPTTYPFLIELIDYLKHRNIKIILTTNGSFRDEIYYYNLMQHLTDQDEVYFALCGNTQSLHEKYRVGSNLMKILNNVRAFQTNNINKNDYGLFIIFEYNKMYIDKMKPIFQLFSNVQTIHTVPFSERFNFVDLMEKNICLPLDLSKQYKKLKEYNLKSNLQISCRSFNMKSVVIDNFGKIYPCSISRMYRYNQKYFYNAKYHKCNYSNILQYKYMFCYECEHNMIEFITRNNIACCCPD